MTDQIKLSPSDAKLILTKTPLHAWQAKRQLGGGTGKQTAAMDDGKILEAMIFNLTDSLIRVEGDSWRGKDAQATKALAIQAGKVPVLSGDYDEYAHAAASMLRGINAAGVELVGGKSQVEIIWNKTLPSGLVVVCHGYIDYLIIGPDFYIIYDLKCVEDASPDKVTRSITDYGWDIQAAAYIEAIEALHPHLAGRGMFRDIFCEKSAPYAVNVPSMSGAFHSLGKRKWDRAAVIWEECLRTNTWPGYQHGVIDPLPWQMSKEPEGAES